MFGFIRKKHRYWNCGTQFIVSVSGVVELGNVHMQKLLLNYYVSKRKFNGTLQFLVNLSTSWVSWRTLQGWIDDSTTIFKHTRISIVGKALYHCSLRKNHWIHYSWEGPSYLIANRTHRLRFFHAETCSCSRFRLNFSSCSVLLFFPLSMPFVSPAVLALQEILSPQEEPFLLLCQWPLWFGKKL